MSEEKKPKWANTNPYRPGVVVYKTGTQARTIAREDKQGIRKFLPFRVEIQCQLSKLAEISETYRFYLYQEDANAAIVVAGRLLKSWFQQERIPFDGYPKPSGEGESRRIEDREFISTYREARERNKELRVNGDPNDPVAFVIRKPSKIILTAPTPKLILPPNFGRA